MWAVGTRIGQGADGGGQHVDQVVELLRPAQPVAHAQQPVEHPVQTGRLLAAHLLVRDRVLHLVQQHVVRFLAIRDMGSHIVGQGVRVGVRGGCRFVRGGIVCRLLSAVVQE